MLVAYTDDNGNHWQEHSVSVVDDNVVISFLDEQRGFLLATSAPAAGHMDKKLLGTADGGRSWKDLAVPNAGAYYPSGVYFNTFADGWIGGTYHGGDDVPLYHTQDGGRTWMLQTLLVPEPFKGQEYYGNTSLPAFKGLGQQHGTLTVSYKQHVHKPYFNADVTYHSEDGGKTWQLPAENVKTVPVD